MRSAASMSAVSDRQPALQPRDRGRPAPPAPLGRCHRAGDGHRIAARVPGHPQLPLDAVEMGVVRPEQHVQQALSSNSRVRLASTGFGWSVTRRLASPSAGRRREFGCASTTDNR